MKKIFIILLLTAFGCRSTKKVPQPKFAYSDYESMGGFNYMEDVIDAFNLDTVSLNPERYSSLDTL